MPTKRIALLVALAASLAACGVPADGGAQVPEDPNAPVLQIRSEGGFAPVDMILGRSPTYTLLADGRLIYVGPTIAIFPGPLLPNYQVAKIEDRQMQLVLDLVDQIGLPEIVRESDESAASYVADATTEVVTYWDANGEHVYSVYGLGIELEEAPSPETRAFLELFNLMADLSAGESVPFQSDRTRVIAGEGFVNEEFEDMRAWPLAGEDLSDWQTLPNGWRCSVLGTEILGLFADATQVTVWESPNSELIPSPLKLLVRPLHPGEPDCPTS